MLVVARRARMLVATLLLLSLFASIAPAGAAPAQAGPVTWTVLVGGEAGMSGQPPMPTWEFMHFYPGTITINVGDTIIWKLSSGEPHTVSFPKPGDKPADLLVPEGGNSQRMMFNPLAAFPQGGPSYDGTAYANSGQLDPAPQAAKEYKLTFTKAGTYDYLCLFHNMMKGQVIVQAAGSAYPKTQAQIDADSKAALATDADAASKFQPEATKVTDRPGPNGTTIHQIKIGWGNGTMAYMRFSPSDLTINAGDTVEWMQGDEETPHTVTLVSGGNEPDLVVAEPQANGAPKLILNPAVLAPAGGKTYSGKDYFNSGFIFGSKNPAPGARTYSLVFDAPGVYEFICVLHDSMGMSGHITVASAKTAAAVQTTSQAAVAAPATTQAAAPASLPASGQVPSNTVTTLGIVLLGMFLFAAGWRVRSHRVR